MFDKGGFSDRQDSLMPDLPSLFFAVMNLFPDFSD
jgi:hypothetical protein